LMITNASRSDIDMYTCTAMNILGKVNASLQLTVQCKQYVLYTYDYMFSEFIYNLECCSM